MEKKKPVIDNSHNNVITTPRVKPKETPFSVGDRIKQIKGVQKTRKQIMDELDKS